jgi:protein O-GlcNAc transferase
MRSHLLRAAASPTQTNASLPNDARAAYQAGVDAFGARRLEAARDLFLRAVQINPRFGEALSNLGGTLYELGRYDEALEAFQRAVSVNPRLHPTLLNLANLLSDGGRAREAVRCFRRAIALAPDPVQHSDLVLKMNYAPDTSARALLKEARCWDRAYAAPLARLIAPHQNDRSPERRLRIGYVSPSFADCVESFFLTPVLEHHDHNQFEIFCYSNVARPDDVTARLRRSADGWRDITAMTDAEAAARIREDRVDLLVDLTMHAGRNRLLLFARKPAPVQVCWLAYPGTSGLSTIDYRLSDPHLDPLGSDTSVYSERTIHLPESFWCYDPLTSEPQVGPPPARSNGHVTFGCLNNFAKVNEDVLALWARVLRAVPSSKLLLQVPEGWRPWALAKLKSYGDVESGRVEFVSRGPRDQYFRTFGSIDVCLDPFPWCGGATSLDSLWCGVPFVTLVGRTAVGRGGLSIAMNLGLPQLVARTHDEYVAIAAALAGDIDRLSELRAGLRARLEASPLMNAPKFAHNLEAAYRDVWRRWCEGRR